MLCQYIPVSCDYISICVNAITLGKCSPDYQNNVVICKINNYIIFYIQVQQKARNIESTIRGDDQSELSSPATTTAQRPKLDKAASVWSTSFCELYRSS